MSNDHSEAAYSMATTTKATAMSENPAVVFTPVPGVSAAPVPAGAADEVALAAEAPVEPLVAPLVEPLVDEGATVEEEEAGLVELGLALVETAVEEEPDVPEVVPAGTVVEGPEPDSGAEVAAAPVPVEVRTASRRLPLLPDATQTPATLLEIS